MRARRIGLGIVGVLALGAAFWLGTGAAPARYQVVEHKGMLVRFNTQTGGFETFVMVPLGTPIAMRVEVVPITAAPAP